MFGDYIHFLNHGSHESTDRKGQFFHLQNVQYVDKSEIS